MKRRPMDQRISELRAQFAAELASASSVELCKSLRDRWVGRESGIISAEMRRLREMPKEERPAFGAAVNALRADVENELESAQARVLEESGRTSETARRVDVTRPGFPYELGSEHPIKMLQASIEDISDEQWERTFHTNIHGYFYMARAAVPHLPPGGAILNCGSITGLEGSKELLDYSATKGAIHTFTKSLAQNLVERGIRVNCVAPGPVWTPLNVADKPASEAGKHGADQPIGRPAQPEEVAPAFVFFASDADSRYITGEVLTLLGGETTAA